MVNFAVAKTEAALIEDIVMRAVAYARRHSLKWGRLELSMDITATHANGCPLRLADLLEADDFDFVHDIAGIRDHIDRRTGALRDCFLPRYAAPERVR